VPLTLAVIDIGSNTATLAVYRATEAGGLDRVVQIGEPLRLYRRLGPDRSFPDPAIERTVELIRRFVTRARQEGAERIQAVATSAVRDARNGDALCDRIRREAGVSIHILDGESEGVCAAISAANTLPITDGVVVDMGGGSLQVARLVTRQAREVTSLPLGALRLTDEFLGPEPITADMIGRLRRHVSKLFEELDWFGGGTLVGIGGSVRALAKIDRRRRGWPLRPGHGYRLDLDAVEETWEQTSRMPLESRRLLPGLADHRAETVVASALVWFLLLRRGGFDHVRVSTYGVREGVAWRMFFGDEADTHVPDVRLAGLGVRFPPRRPIEAALTSLRARLMEPDLARHRAVLLAATWLRAGGWGAAEALPVLTEAPLSGFLQEEVLGLAGLLGDERGVGLSPATLHRLRDVVAEVAKARAGRGR
jgi:exopolyphosphatase/guanosine-5'-triphosphate,3'-diphosphate pyrophosphatase